MEKIFLGFQIKCYSSNTDIDSKFVEIIKSISINESFIWISTEEKNVKAIHVYEDSGFKKTNDYCGEEIILKYELEK